MFDIKIVAVGKLKEPCHLILMENFLKRLKPYAVVEIIEIKAEPFRGSGDKVKTRDREGERLLKAIKQYRQAKVIILEERGREFTSQEFAAFLDNEQNNRLIFLIGGPLGFSEEVKKKAQLSLSLSRLTFLHEMARLLLLEQIYRAAAINKDKNYHY